MPGIKVPGIKPGTLPLPKQNIAVKYPPLPFMGATKGLATMRKIPSYDDNRIGKFFNTAPPTVAAGLTSLTASVQSTGLKQAAANIIRSSKVVKRFGLGKTIGVGLGATVALATASAVSRGKMRRKEREEIEQM